jgi:L-alanine-DL-glutamate epimerase-like enolase superfamily enzyme
MSPEGPVVETDALLSFDANNGYSVPAAIAQGRRFESLDIYHFEEPVAQFDCAGLAQVADALDVSVSAGEKEYTRWQFRDLIAQGRVDILQPDVVKAGGLTECKKIAILAETYNKLFVLHQTQPTVGTAANPSAPLRTGLHLIAALQRADRPQEYTGQRPELDEVFEEPLVLEDGTMRVPDRPGLGLVVNEERLQRLSV